MRRIIKITESKFNRLVKKIISEGVQKNLRSHLETGFQLNAVDNNNKKVLIVIKQGAQTPNEPIQAEVEGQPQKDFFIGPGANQLRTSQTPFGVSDYTIQSVIIGTNTFPVDQEGNF